MSAGHPAPVAGHVDGCRDGLIYGWACVPDAPRRRLAVELVVDGRVVGEALAALARADLAGLGLGETTFGFALACDPAFLEDRPGGAFAALVRVRGGDVLPGGVLELDGASLRFAPDAVASSMTVWPPLIWKIHADDAVGYVDRFGATGVGGWIHRSGNPSPHVLLDIWEADTLVGTAIAGAWRPDLAATRQGDGRWGFLAPMPTHLFDGKWRELGIRTRDGVPILPGPVYVKLPLRAESEAGADFAGAGPPTRTLRPLRLRPERADAPAEPMFSFVINFYNMRREAARTLTSLTRGYQRRIGELCYEVICIDNGSDPPLDGAWISSFGPEFRLVRPSRRLASPCFALNEAAAQATGRYVAIMIDGAHVLTPGVFREVWDALTEAPDAIVALKQWFVGGDQRWLSEAGYTTAQEDVLFDRIAWPKDGYDMFTIGMPVWETPAHWLDDVAESNCLFMPSALYAAIGGMDEKFDEAGAGFANLDLFGRAATASSEPVVALIGEATFHQFHGGTTTNAIESVKEQRVRLYENRYVKLRGDTYRAVRTFDIRVRGQLPSHAALMTRQTPLSPASASVTARLRPTTSTMYFDQGAQDYANSTYVECGLHERSFWLGHRLGIAPSDVLTVQDIIFRLRPDRIVAVNISLGLHWFVDAVIGAYEGPACKVVAVSADPMDGLPRSTMLVAGDPALPATLQAVGRALGTAEMILVLFAPNPGDTTPDAMLQAYAGFVSPRSYLIFMGSVFSQPWLGYSVNWFNMAIRRLVESMPFAIDATANPHLISTSPMGYLQRIGGLVDVDLKHDPPACDQPADEDARQYKELERDATGEAESTKSHPALAEPAETLVDN